MKLPHKIINISTVMNGERGTRIIYTALLADWSLWQTAGEPGQKINEQGWICIFSPKPL